MESAGDTGCGMTFVEKCSVHFDDLDAYGMLYNGRYMPLIDRSFWAYSTRLGFPLGHEDATVVIREIKLTFGEPIRRIGNVDVVFTMTRMSRSSATVEFVVKSDAGEHARGYRTMTKVDPVEGRSKPWSNEARRAFGFESTECCGDADFNRARVVK